MLPFLILVTAWPNRRIGELVAPWDTCLVGLREGTTPVGNMSGWMTGAPRAQTQSRAGRRHKVHYEAWDL